jgi:hypothetical protein
MAAPAASSHTPALAAAPSIAADASPSVAPDAAAASAHIPRNAPTPIISGALSAFNASPTVQQQHHEHFGAFLTLHKQLKASRTAHAHFLEVTHKSDGSLPNSMKLRIVERARFPTVDDQPTFFKTELDELRRLEHDTAKQLTATLLGVKERHIKHLQAIANPQTFISTAIAKFAPYVKQFADVYDEQYKAGAAGAPAAAAAATVSTPLTFPRSEAIAHFEEKLRNRIDEEVIRLIQAEQLAKSTTAAKIAADHQAQEKVMTGGHTGETIDEIATRAAEKHLDKLLQIASPQLGRPNHDPASNPQLDALEAQPRAKKARIATPASRQASYIRTDHNDAPDDEDTSMSDSPSNPFRFNFPPSVFNTPKPLRGILKRRRANQHNEDEKDDRLSDNVDMEDISTVVPSSTSHSAYVPRAHVTFQRGGVPRNTQHRNQRARTANPAGASVKRGGERSITHRQ